MKAQTKPFHIPLTLRRDLGSKITLFRKGQCYISNSGKWRIGQFACEDPENSVWAGDPENFFSHQSISQRAARTSLEKQMDTLGHKSLSQKVTSHIKFWKKTVTIKRNIIKGRKLCCFYCVSAFKVEMLGIFCTHFCSFQTSFKP